MPELNNRDKIIAKLKESESILITVSDSPSVDELASTLALTLAINKSGKHATAVASGEMPDVLEFLNPNKTFENSVDSLRDFIIALNKDKADHLRFKTIGDHVKIFITPYKSTITENDLSFEQGDFNVDFILALGVRDKDHLDDALAAHGRIFHDASVGVLTVGENPSNLSDLNWHDENASSLSEMVLEIIESGSIDKKSLTKPVATALLTGIVAETDRFSNHKASAKIMNIASKLILAGADQQLIISKIIESEEKASEFQVQPKVEIPEIEKSAKSKKRDESVLTIERDEISAEDELENSLEAMKIPEANAFAEIETPEIPKNPEIAKIENLAVDFPAVAPKIAPLPPQIFEIEEEIQPENLNFEETPAPQIEIAPVQFENENPQNLEAPAQNFESEIPQNAAAPEIPQPAANFEQPSAFVSETPVEAQNFEPAPQIEIAPVQFENENPQNLEAPAQNFESEIPQNAAGAREYIEQGDDYYHPQENREIVNGFAENSKMIVQEPVENVAVLPETQPYAQAKTIEPLPAQPVNFEGFPPLPPAPNFEGMMPPMPPMPDFSQIPATGEVPAPDFGLPPAPAQISENDFNFQNQPAQGANASQNNIMTDQIYPQDPSQFRIPGM